MALPKPGKYFIACELNPAHRVLDLPSQHAHQDHGLVQLITGNRSEYQKWLVERADEDSAFFTVRSSLLSGKYIEPVRGQVSTRAAVIERSADGLLLGFYPETDSPFQRWIFEPAGAPNTYYIRNEGSGKYWDLREQDPSHVQQLFRKDTPHQRWLLKAVENEAFP